MKYTVVKLKELKAAKDAALRRYHKIENKLMDVCTHPKSVLRTKSYYHTDTLGLNGKQEHSDYCMICGTRLGGLYEGRPNYDYAESGEENQP